jgi:hypothetical protein
MAEAKKSRAIYWLFTLISLAAFVLLLLFKPQWIWISFPFLGTSLAAAFDVI